MADAVKAVPEGYEGATPYLACSDAAKAIEFYKQAFGATELMRMPDPSGKIGHAELKVGKAIIMLSDESPAIDHRSPTSLGGSPVGIMLYFDDVDTIAQQAVAAGGKLTRELKDEFYGDRTGTLVDPFGHRWFIATHKEDVSPQEMERRVQEFLGQHGGAS
jgi:PhnB protein